MYTALSSAAPELRLFFLWLSGCRAEDKDAATQSVMNQSRFILYSVRCHNELEVYGCMRIAKLCSRSTYACTNSYNTIEYSNISIVKYDKRKWVT